LSILKNFRPKVKEDRQEIEGIIDTVRT
jgi:hypothetical protein